jgi:hypothetical protein
MRSRISTGRPPFWPGKRGLLSGLIQTIVRCFPSAESDRHRQGETDGTATLVCRRSKVRASRRAFRSLAAHIPSMTDRTGMPREATERSTPCRYARWRSRFAAAAKELLDFQLQRRKRALQGSSARIEDDRPLWAQLFQTRPDRFAQPALDAVANDGAANRSRHGEAHPRTGWTLRLGKTESGEPRPGISCAAVVNFSEITRS